MSSLTLYCVNPISNVLSTLAQPVTNILTYLCPGVSSYLYNAIPIEDGRDEKQEAIVAPYRERESVIREVAQLAEQVGIRRGVVPIISSTDRFFSLGGEFSKGSPMVHIPQRHAFRGPEFGAFGQEKNQEKLEQNVWRFTDDETRFQVLRPLVQIRMSERLLKIAVKIAMMAAICLFSFCPVAWPIALPIFIGAVCLYYFMRLDEQNRLDGLAVSHLSQLIGQEQAIQAAICSLEKMREQNRQDREKGGWIGRVLFTREGDKRLDLARPSLTERIERLRCQSGILHLH